MSNFVLTFVHGTWGRGIIWPSGDAVWTTDASTLCRSLRDRLGPDAVFRRFRWSGRNSHTARLNASERLRDFLQEGLTQSPEDATHVVIAHSHGGNVALMALGDSKLRGRIAGLACLATPFIAARDRNIGRDPWTIVRQNSLILLSYVLVALSILFFLRFDTVDTGHSVSVTPSKSEIAYSLLIWVSVLTIAWGLLIGVFLLLRKRVREYASKLRRELEPHPLEKDKLLLIRSPADEASGCLAVFQFLSQATVRLFLFTESLYVNAEDIGKQPRKLFLMGISAFTAYLALGLFPVWGEYVFGAQWDFHAASLWLQIPVLLVVFISCIIWIAAFFTLVGIATFDPFLGVALTALLWLIIPLLSILMLPFGWQAAVANVLLDVTSETTPLGSWEIHLIEPPTSEEIGVPVPPLIHKVYENPRVQTKLSEWIESRGLDVGKDNLTTNKN